MSLQGEDADLFHVSYHSEYEYTANEWVVSQGKPPPYVHHLAIWRKAREGERTTGQNTTAGHVITAAAVLEERDYNFDLLIEFPHSGACSEERIQGDRR